MTDTDNALAVATASKGVYVTQEQYRQACAVDLGSWLLTHRPDAVKLQYGCVVLLADRHISTKRGFHGFTNFKPTADNAHGKGNNVDYLMWYLGYTYQGAVLALLGLSEDEARASRQPSVSSTEEGSGCPVPVRSLAPHAVVLPDDGKEEIQQTGRSGHEGHGCAESGRQESLFLEHGIPALYGRQRLRSPFHPVRHLHADEGAGPV